MPSVDPIAVVTEMTTLGATGLDAGQAIQATRLSKSLHAWLAAFDAGVAGSLAELHAAGSAATPSDVTTRCGGVSAAEAKRRERRAELLKNLASFGDALSDGKVGAEHVDALSTISRPLDEAVKSALFDRQEELVARAATSTPEQFARICRRMIGNIEHDQGVERAERQRRQTRLSRRIDSNGMHHLSGIFDPEAGAALFAAIDAEVGALVAAGGDRSADRQQLAAHALSNLVGGGHQRQRPTETEISVLIDLPTLVNGLHSDSVCEYANGVELPPATVRRLACQGRLIPVVLGGDGVPLDMGRGHRLANRNQRRALRSMYRTCAFPGCDCAFDRCEMHHLLEFEHGGPTDLANLLPLCARHHHMVHELGWHLELAPDRTLTVIQPDGVWFAAEPIHVPPRRPAGRPITVGPEPPPGVPCTPEPALAS